MHIADVLAKPGIHFSFEFFPPKTEKSSGVLFQSIKELAPIEPAYVSVTYGAGGSSRDLTHDLVVRARKETNLTVVAHLTTIGATKSELREILERYSDSGIENIMALRGDRPKGVQDFFQPKDGFEHAVDLVKFIKKEFPHMGVGVAGFPEGHPETPNRLKEMDYLKAKVDAGADYICTQLFFKNGDYYDFRDRCALAKIHVPIIAGIMPITSRSGMERISELALGARIPAKLQRAISRTRDDEAVAKVGIHWATQQVFDLFDRGVTGIHFYTLNKSKPTLKIYGALGVSPEDKPR
ncbi:MAG: methylenetetrahydrofolate reductase [NAD(P)H] [Anaerolineae bacterium]|jgi:methylenetetrahydrofolate reductase (NADPH)|nr:methylenetetrahydrofolate reductase [NAD(P)H] [Anaerolineae bacterium]MBT7071631.1 methylenetetrahydrofolate reductase [NAD(P)H] [Anaerolineae bacterium]MBT7324248.1 methylenetetrahydrofolate reductase [NAD(P)H] [Anaerolineae bacterium]